MQKGAQAARELQYQPNILLNIACKIFANALQHNFNLSLVAAIK